MCGLSDVSTVRICRVYWCRAPRCAAVSCARLCADHVRACRPDRDRDPDRAASVVRVRSCDRAHISVNRASLIRSTALSSSRTRRTISHPLSPRGEPPHISLFGVGGVDRVHHERGRRTVEPLRPRRLRTSADSPANAFMAHSDRHRRLRDKPLSAFARTMANQVFPTGAHPCC